MHQEAQSAGNGDVEADVLALVVRHPEEAQVAGAGLEVALEGGQLRRLVLVDVLGLEVAGDERRQRGDGGEDERAGEGAPGELLVLAS